MTAPGSDVRGYVNTVARLIRPQARIFRAASDRVERATASLAHRPRPLSVEARFAPWCDHAVFRATLNLFRQPSRFAVVNFDAAYEIRKGLVLSGQVGNLAAR